MSFTKVAAALGAVIALSSIAAVPAHAEDRRVRIINSSNVQLDRFYASNASVTDWQEDILGQRVLPAGESLVINIDDGTGACLYDFKAVFHNGRTDVAERINVCQISEYTYH
jgi:hypothetical protein